MALPAEVTTSTETKPGIYTTEFWVTLAANALGLLELVGNPFDVQNKYVVLALGVVNGLYAFSRGLAKQGQPHVPEVVEAELQRRAEFEEAELTEDDVDVREDELVNEDPGR